MYRIDNATAISPIPAPAAAGPNPNAFFTKGNPALAVPATIVDDDWANAVQEELAGTVEGAGIALSKVNRAQLLQAIQTLAGNVGQCRLSRASAISLVLSPLNGNYLKISNVAQKIPAAGVALSNAGLVANTVYYIYAFMNAGVMTLEPSATGHSTDATSGMEIKTGDATRTLVGMIKTSNNTPGQFVDSGTQRYVANWFNRRQLLSLNTVATTNTAAAVPTDVMAANHAEFLTWADTPVSIGLIVVAANNISGSSINTTCGVDGVASFTVPNQQITCPANNALTNCSIPPTGASLAEGYHYATLAGFAGSNTATWTNPTIFATPFI